ncbi:hypothetical protein [Cupriavidus pauculus]|jgi:hypothetical protein|uniref:hypothetical protein n=1 Tax=Cupriavidus pauculus TaxID=82633 RepID=UPI0030FA488A
MKKFVFYFSMLTLCHVVNASAQEIAPKLSFVKIVPSLVARRLANDGYALFAQKKFISWNEDGAHYFVLIRDKEGGCGLVDFNGSSNDYKIIDSYDQCKITHDPQIKDLVGDGSQAIVVRLQVHSNSMSNVDVNQTTAYLYVPTSNQFCKNDDAGKFAAGIRVPNSVIRFGPSACY